MVEVMALGRVAVVLFLLSVALVAAENGRHPLKIQVLVPKANPSYSAEGTLPAMQLATDDVNSSPYLSAYNLTLIVSDTKVSVTKCVHTPCHPSTIITI